MFGKEDDAGRGVCPVQANVNCIYLISDHSLGPVFYAHYQHSAHAEESSSRSLDCLSNVYLWYIYCLNKRRCMVKKKIYYIIYIPT